MIDMTELDIIYRTLEALTCTDKGIADLMEGHLECRITVMGTWTIRDIHMTIINL